MALEEVERLTSELRETQDEILRVFESVAAQPEWAPRAGEWSFREIAAHLATVEVECFRDRVRRLAAGESPTFEYYLNTDRDFSGHDLRESLRKWVAARREILDFLQSLPEEKLSLTGVHETFGVITVVEAVEIMLEHDREHLAHLKGIVRQFRHEKG